MANPTACVILIGNEVLSGRTRDLNLEFLGRRLGEIGIPVREARVIPDAAHVDRRYRQRGARALRVCVHHRRHRTDP